MKKLITTCCVAVSLLLPVAMSSTAQAEPYHHPEIHQALEALVAARAHLLEAKHDFGGHRKAAIAAIDAAIRAAQDCNEIRLRPLGFFRWGKSRRPERFGC